MAFSANLMKQNKTYYIQYFVCLFFTEGKLLVETTLHVNVIEREITATDAADHAHTHTHTHAHTHTHTHTHTHKVYDNKIVISHYSIFI
jgi:hypothetical protein